MAEEETKSSKQYARDYLALRSAIIENCRDCIRDCGRDCLDLEAKPVEIIKCPLQKVRMEYEISIKIENHTNSKWKLIKKDDPKITG